MASTQAKLDWCGMLCTRQRFEKLSRWKLILETLDWVDMPLVMGETTSQRNIALVARVVAVACTTCLVLALTECRSVKCFPHRPMLQ